MVYTGLRREEFLGLRWKDINLDEKVLHVNRAAIEVVEKGIKYVPPKNESSQRTVNFDTDVANKLYFFLKKQFKYYNHENIVFLNINGSIIRPDYVKKKYKKVVKEVGLKSSRFHDLRHTHATWLLKLGINPKIVQERLGHNKISTTLDKYSHVIPSMQKQTVKKLKKSKN